MPFEELETHTKDNMPPVAKLSYLVGTRVKKADPKPKLIVSMPTVLFTTKCKKFQIHIGTGADRGKLRIVGLKQGVPGKGVPGRDFKNHVILRFGHVPKLGEDVFDGVDASIVKIDEDTYDLKVPESILPEEETPPKIPLRAASGR